MPNQELDLELVIDKIKARINNWPADEFVSVGDYVLHCFADVEGEPRAELRNENTMEMIMTWRCVNANH